MERTLIPIEQFELFSLAKAMTGSAIAGSPYN